VVNARAWPEHHFGSEVTDIDSRQVMVRLARAARGGGGRGTLDAELAVEKRLVISYRFRFWSRSRAAPSSLWSEAVVWANSPGC
jgi:hypothetical protein